MVASRSEEELIESLGASVGKPALDQILKVYEFSLKQLPAAEALMLPSPKEKRQHHEVGRTIFRASKRAIWKALCDPESDTYKMWFKHGVMWAVDRKVVGLAVAQALYGFGIGVYAIAIPLTALLIKLGIDVFCETFSPDGLMIGLDGK